MVNKVIYTVSATFERMEDARAFAELASELGISTEVQGKTLNVKPRTPMREQRLGAIILEEMRKHPRKWWSPADFESLLKRERYKPRSAAPVLSILTAEGDIDRAAHGLYVLRRKE